MVNSKSAGGGILRWLARILGLLVGIAYLFVLYLVFIEPRDFPLIEIPALLCLLVLLVSIGLGWFNAQAGGKLALLAGLATTLTILLAAQVEQSSNLWLALAYGLPGVIVGGFYWLSTQIEAAL